MTIKLLLFSLLAGVVAGCIDAEPAPPACLPSFSLSIVDEPVQIEWLEIPDAVKTPPVAESFQSVRETGERVTIYGSESGPWLGLVNFLANETMSREPAPIDTVIGFEGKEIAFSLRWACKH